MSACRAFFLVGPTAAGKTAVAQHIAERRGWAVLAADSMTVYRGMDIGTAKPSPEERRRVPYGGLDLADPSEGFSVGAYRIEALRFLNACVARNLTVIVVGGSGLYVKSLTHGLAASPAESGRGEHWERVWQTEGVEGLQRALARLRPDLLAALRDPLNPRRLLRALGVAEAGGGEPAAGWRAAAAGRLVGIEAGRAFLAARIAARTRSMFAGGLVAETERLRHAFPRLSRTAACAIGYAEAAGVLDGALTPEAAAERAAVRTRRLAKRQRTWFRHQEDVEWIAVDEGDRIEDIADRVVEAWGRNGATAIVGE
jgi:tRNA dimethylallyltransferase